MPITVGGGSPGVDEGVAVTTDSQATLIAGVDGVPGDAKVIRTNSSGQLEVVVVSGAGEQFDDGDPIDTDSQGTLIVGTTGVSGIARAIRVETDGAVHVSDGGDSLTVDGTVAATQSGTWNINDITGTVSLPTGAATAANQLPNSHDVTVDNAGGAAAVNIQDGGNSITVDGTVNVSGTVAVTQSGTWNINDISGTISLPTGAATAANQLPDGHNVTVDNAAGASAVNIQDGGNSITVDGTVAATQSGTWDINNISGTISLPTGAATSANQLPDGHNVTVDNASGAAAVNIQDGGNSITIDATSLPLPTGAATAANQLPDGHNVTVDNAAGGAAVNIQDGGNSITIDGTIAATQSGTWILGANSGVDIGDVTVDNAAGAGAVNIQDGGNSITIDAASLPLPTGASTLAEQQSQTTLLTTIAGDTTSLDTKVPAQGAALIAASMPVNIASDQTVPISAVSLPLPTGAATAANQLPDGHNVTVDNAAGASAVNIQDGGNSITIDATSLPLPTGAATAANQLPDGHNVTVDNAGGVDAVNIQDGGNSITVDGTVAATQSGTWNINNISGTISLPTGAATSANQLPDGHNVTVDNASGAAAVNIQDGGNSITVDGTVSATQSGTWTVDIGTIPEVEIKNDAGNPIAVSPSSPSDTIALVNITALNGTAEVSTQGRSTVTFQISGTWVATLVFEATVNGTTWFQIVGTEMAVVITEVTSITANKNIMLHCGSFAQVRVRASAFTSGTVVVDLDASSGTNDIDPTYGNNNVTAPSMSQLIAGIDNTSTLRPLLVDDQGRLVTSAITGFGADFSFGDRTTAATTRVLVQRTTYTEQTTNAQRSIASASALDTAAGTGARTVRITYLDSTGAGPFTETVTLNGAVFVNTVATNICFIEQIEVLTAGSTGSNAGILTLKEGAAGAGATIGTINATNNQTFWCHHYVPTGKVANITGISCGHTGTTVGSGALFTLAAKSLAIANSVETQVSDFVRLYGQTSTFARAYTSPIKVTGPARLQMYLTPETSSSTTYRAAFDFFEP